MWALLSARFKPIDGRGSVEASVASSDGRPNGFTSKSSMNTPDLHMVLVSAKCGGGAAASL